jgi:hypothetical protein
VSEVFLVRGATAELGLKLARRRGFDGAIDFVVQGAPKGVRIAKVEPVDQGRMMRMTLAADDAAALGRSSVTIFGTGAGAPRAETGPRVTIQVN